MKSVKNKLMLCIGSALMLSSCAVKQKYTREDLKIPSAYKENIVVTGDTTLLPWKQFFKDPQLVVLIERALQKNVDVSVALLNIQQVELTYKQSKLGYLPSLDANINASRVWNSSNSLNGQLNQAVAGTSNRKYFDDYNATIALSWEADFWGKVSMQKAAARANYFAQKENLAALKTRIIAQVAQAYNNLTALDEQLKVAERNSILSDSTLKMIRLQFNSAQANSLAVEQAEAQKKTAELLVPLTKQNIEVQENALSILCGGFPERIARSSWGVESNVTDVFPTGVPASLLSRRPDVRAAEFAVMAATAQAGISKAAMFPTVTLAPSIGLNSMMFHNWFDMPGSVVKNLASGLVQPLFRKKQLRTEYERSQLEKQKVAEQFRQSVITAVGEVSDALVKTKYADERLILVNEKQAALEKATRNAMLLFRNAMATYLEVIVAQNNSLQNELDRTEIKRDRMNALIDIYRSLGGGTE
jgi:multidrug efflux system outer membrane protein